MADFAVGTVELDPQSTGIVVNPPPVSSSPIGHLFITPARHYRSGRFHDGQGGWSDDWTLVGTILCRVSTPSGRDAAIAGQRQATVTHALYADSSLDIQYADGLEIEGRWYVVVIPDLRPSIREHHLKCLLEQSQKRPSVQEAA